MPILPINANSTLVPIRNFTIGPILNSTNSPILTFSTKSPPNLQTYQFSKSSNPNICTNSPNAIFYLFYLGRKSHSRDLGMNSHSFLVLLYFRFAKSFDQTVSTGSNLTLVSYHRFYFYSPDS